MKKATLACLLCLSAALAFGQGKIGHVNTGLVLESLPETAVADSMLRLYQDSLAAGGKVMQDTFVAKLTYLQENEGDITPRRAQELQAELQELQQQMQVFQQEAARMFDVRRGQYLQPIVNRLSDAVRAYAKTNGYALILDSSVPQSLLFANEDNDLTPVMIAELGGAQLTLSTE